MISASHPRRAALFVATTVLFTAVLCSGDTLVTKDGSTLHGDIQEAVDGTVKLKTDFAGTLAVQLDQVARMEIDAPAVITLASGNRLIGRLTMADGGMAVESDLGTLDISGDRIVTLYPEGSAPPAALVAEADPAAKPPEWSYEGTVDIGGKTGNTERFSAAASLAATRTHEDETLKLYAATEKVEEDGTTSSDELLAGIDFERVLNQKHSWYARTEMGRDDIEQVDLRTVASLGYGYHFLRQEDHKLRMRLGGLFRHESYSTGTDEQTVGVDLGLRDDWFLTKSLRMINDVSYTPSLEDAADYRVTHTSSLETPLQVTKGDVRLRLGVTNEYDSKPVPGLEYLDTAYFARLVFGW